METIDRKYSDKMIFAFKIILASLYIAMGGFVIYLRARMEDYPQAAVWAFPLVCIAYGLLRMWRAWEFYNAEEEVGES